MTLLPDLLRHQEANGGPHRSGTLSAGPLKRIEDLLATGFDGAPIRTAETGCGASTVLFAHYSSEHHSYTLDDTAHPNSSVNYARKFHSFDDEKVKWHFGPTQRTLIAEPPTGKFDMVLLDGLHGYPWPEFEYSFFYRLLKQDGILILDDIHIPSIRNMFTFLAEDDMFYLDSVVYMTAFFRRSDIPLFLPDGDNWVTQRYNVQQFPAPYPLRGMAVHKELTVTQDNIGALKQYVKRGFTTFNGDMSTEGRLSMLEVPFTSPMSGTCRIKITINPLFADDRNGALVELYINYEFAGRFDLTESNPIEIEAKIALNDADQIEIKFHNAGLVAFEDLKQNSNRNIVDKRLMNFVITHFSLSVD